MSRRTPLLLVLLLLSVFFLLSSSSFFSSRQIATLDNLELCFQSKKCKSGCCRRVPPDCESHCAAKGSEGSLCHTQMFTGLYNECPCQPNLTCVFPKNQKSFKIIYGHCKKIDKKKPATKSVF